LEKKKKKKKKKDARRSTENTDSRLDLVKKKVNLTIYETVMWTDLIAMPWRAGDMGDL
jgi:hypothetical protein